MTEKRFTVTQDFEEHHRQIRDNGRIIMGCFIEPQAEVIVDLLNELYDENYMLKKSNEYLQEYNNKLLRKPLFTDVLPNAIEIMNINTELEKENEQLNEENQLLKEEKELLKNKLDRIEDILPHYLSCAEISEFRGKTVKEDIALMKCWNKRYQK